MRLIKIWILGLLFSVSSAQASDFHWHHTLWNPALKIQLPPKALDELARSEAVFVLGEEHYNPSVQHAEAWLLERIARSGPVILGWEFLNTVDRLTIDASYSLYRQQLISIEEFLQKIFPAGPGSTEYAPVLETARLVQAQLIPTNLSRAQKSPVTRGGINALDPALLPSDFKLGGPFYEERFQAAMGTHPLPYPLANYFAAQSLTDEVMATELLKGPAASTRVLITGSFHADYRDGVVASLVRRSPGQRVVYIRIVDASLMTEEELEEFWVHPRYGAIGDLLFIVNEPRN